MDKKMQLKYEQMLGLIDTLFQAMHQIITTQEPDASEMDDVKKGIDVLKSNIDFIFIQSPDLNKIEDLEALAVWLTKLESHLQVKHEIMNINGNKVNNADTAFKEIIEQIRKSGYNGIYETIRKSFLALPLEYRNWVQVCFEYNKFFFGSINESKNDYAAFRNRSKALFDHIEDFCWLYDHLSDYRSRLTLLGVIKVWLTFDNVIIDASMEKLYRSYFDLDIIHCDENEVFVDLGAYTGDTILDYVNTYGNKYKKIYAYEITPASFNEMKRNLKHLPNITFCQRGVSNTKGKMMINSAASAIGNTLSQHSGTPIDTVTLDEDIKEPISFIKMDIEGSEQKAIQGCANHIKNSKPKLAISVYHNHEDIWKIARMINDICPGYRFYLRFGGVGMQANNVLPTEVTLLAVNNIIG